MIRYVAIFLLFLSGLDTQAQGLSENNQAPQVRIMKPKTGELLSGNALVPYAVDVKDAEDGHSAYEEINTREVLLVIKHLKDPSLVKDYKAKLDQDLAPLVAMSKSNCLNCHAATAKLIGPSFELIAQKYSGTDKAKTYLTGKILHGSTGVWGEEKMPPQPDLAKEQVSRIVDWILRQDKDPVDFQVGLKGAFRTRESAKRANGEVYVLSAVYEDHGEKAAPEKNKKWGVETLVLSRKE